MMGDGKVDLMVGERIAARRRTAAMSRDALASAVVISPFEFGQVEAGRLRPSPEMLSTLAAALNTTIAILMSTGNH